MSKEPNKAKAKKSANKFHKNEALNNILQRLAKASNDETQTFSPKQKKLFINKLVQQTNS